MTGEQKAIYIRNKILEKIREKKRDISYIYSHSGIDKTKIRDAFENPTENVVTLMSLVNALNVDIKETV